MMWWPLLYTAITAICGFSTSDAENVSVLTSGLTGDLAYHGQRVSFVCNTVVTHDTIITWTSPHYIGRYGERLQLLSTEQDGFTERSQRFPTTVAILVNTTRTNETVTILSKLQLIASGLYPSSRVSCRANGHEPAIITFRVHPPVTLTHNLSDDAVAYNGQRIKFTCMVNVVTDLNYIIIIWRSAHYIGTGQGSNLRLNSSDPVNTIIVTNSQNPTTVANLINTTQSSNRVITVVSELHLTASVQYPTSDVSCRATGLRPIVIGFRVDPLVVLTHNLGDDAVAYKGQRVTFRCTITVGRHIVITWSSDDYIGTGGDNLQLLSIDPEGQNTTNTRNPTTIAFLINTTRINRVITVISELQLTASELYPTSNVSCGINGGLLYGDTITFHTLPVDATTMMATQSNKNVTSSIVGTTTTMIPESNNTGILTGPMSNSNSVQIGRIIDITAGIALIFSLSQCYS